MKIVIGADHGGFKLKESLVRFLKSKGHEVKDIGAFSEESCDYPVIGYEAAKLVAAGAYSKGVLICRTGIGMSMAANKVRGIRAALCDRPNIARSSRKHNDSNILVFAANIVTPKKAKNILEVWLTARHLGDRHARRVHQIKEIEGSWNMGALEKVDPEIYNVIHKELKRQQNNIELIASENFTSIAVLEAAGSVLTNKYAEGYLSKRWYGGCECVDDVESLAIERAKKIFGAEHVNVQPHSGSQANMAVYFALLQPGDTVLAMDLASGGHLTHGFKHNFSGRFFNVISYGLNKDTEMLDYNEIDALAKKHKPRMILAGASSYSRVIDFKRFRNIADKVGAYLFVDMAHIAGLVAAGLHPNPVEYAHVVSTTTHKTLRGPRGGMILCKQEFAKKIDIEVFPGEQGGPLMHIIAAKAVALKEAETEEFKQYQSQTIKNARSLAKTLNIAGYRIVSGGTDNHLFLVDLTSKNITGKAASEILDKIHITVNKNLIPFDKNSPSLTSGIRLGTAAVTTIGMKEKDMENIADIINRAVKYRKDIGKLGECAKDAAKLIKRFPLYPELG